MSMYVLLLFNWDDDVEAVKHLRASDPNGAVRLAETIALAHPRSAGYQIWLQGRRISATYPVEVRRHSGGVPSHDDRGLLHRKH